MASFNLRPFSFASDLSVIGIVNRRLPSGFTIALIAIMISTNAIAKQKASLTIANRQSRPIRSKAPSSRRNAKRGLSINTGRKRA